MKNQIFTTVSALVLTALLTACGGQQDVQVSNHAAATSAGTIAASPLAAAIGSDGASTAPAGAALVPAASAAAGVINAANMPQPDCAPEGCNSLRIIDGNAEAWRIDAAHRAALEARL